MKLQQLKYLIAIADNNLSITNAAQKIFTSQPGISKQLRLLEDELQTKIFERNGKQLVGITQVGNEILGRARKVMQEINNIKRLSSELSQDDSGCFSIGTTQTQAQYVLPRTFAAFHKEYPNLKIDLQQGTTEQVIEQLRKQEIDFVIASGTAELGPDIVQIPCYQWDRSILFPQDHELGDLRKITLEDVVKYPLVTYNLSDKNSSSLMRACKKEKLEPNIVFTARDADIIKTYVRKGFGVGIIANMAYDPQADKDLISYPTSDMLPQCTTWLAFHKNLFLKQYMKDFIAMFAPHISQQELIRYLYSEHTSSKELLSRFETKTHNPANVQSRVATA
ncbi:MAG: LysR substrate-binding domain-containing protein [Kangiella sp.]|jgi:LysR family cys regulon transcriptional activator|nr:LysR substrate-binding domain-containing protein [Kangiella sp.]MCW9027809.1 LysR substrate-binding domain-containing protein [Kangiella sp.]